MHIHIHIHTYTCTYNLMYVGEYLNVCVFVHHRNTTRFNGRHELAQLKPAEAETMQSEASIARPWK